MAIDKTSPPIGGETGKASKSPNKLIDRALEPHLKPDRVKRIQEAAYRRAQERGFGPGAELDDWLAAEREIDQATK